MAASNHTIAKLIEIVEPVVEDAGYELVSLEYRREQPGWVIRVFIDWPHSGDAAEPERGIGFADCEVISRELGPVLDVADPVEHAYNLEVSSPGIARPLRTAAHFRRFAGQRTKVALRDGLDGRRRFTGDILEVIDSDGGERVAVDVDGTRFELPVADIDSAELVPDWDAEMAKSRRKQAEAQS